MIKNNPVFKLLLPFIVGIVLSLCFPINSPLLKQSIFISIFIAYISVTLLKPGTTRNNVLNVLLILLFFTLGMARTAKDILNTKEYSKSVVMLSQLTDFPDSTARSIKLKIDIKKVYEDSAWKNMNTGAIIYLPKSDASKNLQAGDLIYTFATPQSIENMGNPGEFDYKKWSNSNGVFYQFYVSQDHWKKAEHIEPLPINIVLKRLRKTIFNYYKNSGIKEDELAVFSALTLGDKSMLDSELRQGYSAAGLMHILAVSGLHVGLVYAVILALFKPISKNKWGKILRFGTSIIILWGYAMLTGLSPSVTRAATMFTIFAAGDMFGKKYAVYNSMALAAFILLYCNPNIISNIGFQMSFLAVFGIVALYPYIYKWLYIKNKALDKIWQIMAVSIAAQAITTPLSLYYFNQFPALFLVSNILMIPLATILMYLFVFFIAVSPFPTIAVYMAKIIDWGTWLMNEFTHWINSVEWATLKGLAITEIQTLLLYAILTSAVLWGLKTNFKNFKILALMIIGLLLSLCYEQYILSQKKSCIVFNTYNEPLLLTTSGNEYNVWNPEQIDDVRYTQSIVLKNELKPSNSGLKTLKNQACIFGNDNRRGIYYNMNHVPKTDAISCNWLILSSKSPYNLNELLKQIEPQIIIADATISPYMLKKWKEQTQLLDIKIFDVKQNGAYVEEWSD